MNKIKSGMLFTQNIPSSMECNVFICLAEHKFLKFTCENKEETIIKNVRGLRLYIGNVPSWTICNDLPNDASEGSTGALSPTSLKDILKNIK